MKKIDQSAQFAALNHLILRSIVDHAVVTLDANGIITSWNEGAERVLGWAEDEVVGKSADVFFTDEDRKSDRLQSEMRQALEKGRAEDVRWHVRKGGERFWGSGLMTPLLLGTDAAGDPVRDPDQINGYVKIFRDRTAEREADLRVVRLRDRTRLAMSRLGTVGVYEYDVSSDMVFADAVFARLHQLDAETTEQGISREGFFAAIAKADHAVVREAFEAAIGQKQDLDVTYRTMTGGPKPVWVQAQATYHEPQDGASARLIGIATDITEHREDLRMHEARLEFSDSVRELSSETEIAALASKVIGETIYVDRAGYGAVSPDGDTIDVRADWNEGDGHSLVGTYKFSDFGNFGPALQRGETVIIEDAAADPRIEHPDRLREIGVQSVVNMPLMARGHLQAVLFVNDGQPRAWSDAELSFMRSTVDRSFAAMDRLKLGRERDLLTEELAHRMKNLLTLAQVVVKQSLRGIDGLGDARTAIDNRLRALSAAQDILTRAREDATDIRTVLETVLVPHGLKDDRIEIIGSYTKLRSEQVLGLSLALHELATNAAKHGALSNDAGRVKVEWTVDGEDFRFLWVESDGPGVKSPDTRGFGSTILQNAVGGYFSGQSKLAFPLEGVQFEIVGTLD